MNKKIIFVLTATAMTLGAYSPALAQPARNENRVVVRDFQEIREERKEAIEIRNIEMRDQAERIREERKEDVITRQEELKERIQGIRDERKRAVAERLAENIDRLNKNLSSRYNGFLNAMELVLDKIEVRIAKIEETRGVDLSEIYTRIQDSRNFIERAREQVIEQAAKSYIVVLESEETLREDFSASISDLREDHRALRDQFISPLRTIIRDVMETLKEEVGLANQGQEEVDGEEAAEEEVEEEGEEE